MVKNKVAIVTGASQGLGKAVSLRLGKMGAKVALVARNEKLLEEVQQSITSSGGIAEYFVCDVTIPEKVNKTVQVIIKTFGNVDILYNGAGIWTRDVYEEKNLKLAELAFKVNSLGPIYLTKAVLPIMKKKNKGHIFNVISVAGLDESENKDWPTYTATKWSMTGYTKAIKNALLNTKIKVTAFYPHAFESNIFETAGDKDAHNQPWMMRTEDVADAILYALDAPDDVWIRSIEMSKI